VADQNRIRAIAVERPVGLVGDLERGRARRRRVELQRLVGAEAHDQRLRVLRFAQPNGVVIVELRLGHLFPGGLKHVSCAGG